MQETCKTGVQQEKDGVGAMRKGVDRTDVVVIGGGIMGASTALWLAERGLA